MMTEEQRNLLNSLLKADKLEQEIPESALEELHQRIKRAYVIHRPESFRVMVSHDDYDRFPGSLKLNLGDTVNLVSFTTERYVPVEVIELPKTSIGYYRGVITQQLAINSKFEVGDSVYFSEDQVRFNPQIQSRPTR